jgi:hypothetical protein
MDKNFTTYQTMLSKNQLCLVTSVQGPTIANKGTPSSGVVANVALQLLDAHCRGWLFLDINYLFLKPLRCSRLSYEV